MQRILKWLKQSPWRLLPVLGLIPLSALVARDRFSFTPTAQSASPAPAPSTAAPAPAPLVSPTPTAVASPKPKPQKTPVPLGPDGKPILTPEQQALNRRAKAAFEASMASVDSFIEMHVAIAEGVSSLAVGASTSADLLDEKGKSLGQLPAQTLYAASTDGESISLGSSQLPGLVWIQPAPDGVLYVGDQSRPYRGRLLLLTHKGKLWAINYVDLRHYLYSVVGSEVSPSWPMAALKAQAIAARSYALVYYFRPASSFFHLGATEYYQVYSGISREADSVQQAVDATAGEFVSYRGGVVESLYAASDDIVMEAFQGKGMSQLGAYDLAKQGWSDRQILSHYYPSTGVGRIELDHE